VIVFVLLLGLESTAIAIAAAGSAREDGVVGDRRVVRGLRRRDAPTGLAPPPTAPITIAAN
jgi:hypothetical protein